MTMCSFGGEGQWRVVSQGLAHDNPGIAFQSRYLPIHATYSQELESELLLVASNAFLEPYGVVNATASPLTFS